VTSLHPECGFFDFIELLESESNEYAIKTVANASPLLSIAFNVGATPPEIQDS
jgi:hypothetical protein